MLQDKLHTFVARFTVPLVYLLDFKIYRFRVRRYVKITRSLSRKYRQIVSYPGETAGLSAW